MTQPHSRPLLHKPEVLIVEDDPQIRIFLKAMLTSDGCRIHEAVDGCDGLAQATARNPNLVLLDLGLPDKDGIGLIRDIRKWSQMPILVISARTGERDKIEALDAGADDYVTKPFVPGEVSARIRSIFRRTSTLKLTDENGVVSFGNIEVRLSTRRVFVRGHEIHLTPNEYKLLEVLLRYAENVVTHRQLLKEVWGPEHTEESQYLRVFMRQLRIKLETDPAHPRHFITEPGIGYRLLMDRDEIR